MPTTINLCTGDFDANHKYTGTLPFPTNADIVICPAVTIAIFEPDFILGSGRTLTVTRPCNVSTPGDMIIPGGVTILSMESATVNSDPISLNNVNDLISTLGI